MKSLRTHVAVLILLILTTQSFSQSFHGGLKAGIVASEVSGDNLSGPRKLGAYASAFTFFQFSEFALMQLEIMYIEKGSRAVPIERNNFNEYVLRLQYVEVPLYFIANIARYTDMNYLERLWLYGGLSISSLVGYVERDELGFDITGIRDDFYPAELNIKLGISYPISANIDFVFGFSNSLTPIRPHYSGATRWYNQGQYNTLWTFGLAYVMW
jgi:hypothetical protein